METSPGTVSLSRKERERLARRTSILDVARQVFAEKGYAGATLDEIAVRAEFGKGTLYNYFPEGKEEMLFAVVERVYDELVELIQTSFPEDGKPSAREQFEDFLVRCFDHFSAHRALFAILIKEAYRMALSEEPARVRHFVRQRGRVARALAVPVARAIERGEIRPLPAETVAHMLIGNIQGCQMLLSVNDCEGLSEKERPDWTATEAARFMSVMLFDGLLAQNRPETPDNDRE